MEAVEIINNEILYYYYKDRSHHYRIEKKYNGYKALLELRQINCYLSDKQIKFHSNAPVYNVQVALMKDSNKNTLTSIEDDHTYTNIGASHMYWLKKTLLESIKYLKGINETICIVIVGADQKKFDLYKRMLIPFGFKLKNNSKSYKQNYLYYE